MGFIKEMFGGGKKKEAPKPAPVKIEDQSGNVDAEKMKRVGRAALIATSERGVLNNASVGRRALQ